MAKLPSFMSLRPAFAPRSFSCMSCPAAVLKAKLQSLLPVAFNLFDPLPEPRAAAAFFPIARVMFDRMPAR
jgi:hypothetical protein